MAKKNEIKDLVLAEYKKGNIVVSTFEGLKTMSLNEFIKQPVEGILYDLNRNETVVLTFIDEPKWINDFAVAKVIQKLASEIKKRDAIIELWEELQDTTINDFENGLIYTNANKRNELRKQIETLKSEIK